MSFDPGLEERSNGWWQWWWRKWRTDMNRCGNSCDCSAICECRDLQCYACCVCDCQASNDSSEPASAGVASAAASDLSWEQVEEKDSRVTLWVPDHVVTHCAGCHQEFWMVRRKHHCRSAADVFMAIGQLTLYPLRNSNMSIGFRAE